MVCFAYVCMRQLSGGSLEVLSDVFDENDDLFGLCLGVFVGLASAKYLYILTFSSRNVLNLPNGRSWSPGLSEN